MKKLKYILTALLAVVSFCVPFALTGCARHYKINVSITEGAATGNDVKIILANDNTSKSAVGENEIEKGSTFVYAVCPGAHYEVFYIKEDDVTRYHADQQNNEVVPDADRIVRPRIANVKADHKIEVAFRLRTYSITYFYKNPEHTNDPQNEPAYLQLKYANGSVYTTEKQAGQNVTIPGFSNFGFKIFDGTQYINFPLTVDTFPLMADYVLYTDKTVEELKELLHFNEGDAGSGTDTSITA